MKRNVWRVIACTVALSVAASLSACASTSTSSDKGGADSAPTLHAGFAAPLTSGEYWNNLTANTVKEFEAQNVKIDVQSAESDMAKQAELVNNFVTMGVSHIIVDPVDPTSIADSLIKARSNGVKVVVSGSIPADKEAYDIALNTSQTDIGDAVAREAAAWIEKTYPDAEPGSVGVAIFGVYERDVDTERCEAYKNIPNYTDKASISVEYNIGWTDSQSKCQSNTELMLQQFPETKVILAYGDYTLFIDEVLQRSGVDLTQYAAYGNDMSDAVKESIRLNGEGKSAIVGTSVIDGEYPDLYLKAVKGELETDDEGQYMLPVSVMTYERLR